MFNNTYENCFGLIYNGSLQGISDIDTDDSKVEVCPPTADPVISGNPHSQLGDPVSKSEEESEQYTPTVLSDSWRSTVIMQDPGPSYSTDKGDLDPIFESTRPPTSGHKTETEVRNLQSDNQSERRRIIRAVGLEDSDEDEPTEHFAHRSRRVLGVQTKTLGMS